jgi:hypothetical protein
VQGFDDTWLLPPQNRELFDSGKACLARLQGFALLYDKEGLLVPGTPPNESQGSSTIFVKPFPIRTPERLRGPPCLTPALEASTEASPEASPEPTGLPASTAPARMEERHPKRHRIAQKLYTNSQYEL